MSEITASAGHFAAVLATAGITAGLSLAEVLWLLAAVSMNNIFEKLCA
jgi:hypothetical protein